MLSFTMFHRVPVNNGNQTCDDAKSGRKYRGLIVAQRDHAF
jgi:hypothetical protein